MHSDRIESYLSFMDLFEYPMVLLEKESGKVLKLNYPAQTVLGKDVDKLTIKMDTSQSEDVFTRKLEAAKSFLWYRILLEADNRRCFVSGIVNTFTEDGIEYYALIFEARGGLQQGSMVLERVVNRSRYVIIYLYVEGDEWKTLYVSQNIEQYGYTSEQFYRGIMGVQDMMTPEDYLRLRDIFKEKADSGENEFSAYTYWIGENEKKHYVRMDMHYDKDQYGNIIGMDFLVHDLGKEQKESEENQYLRTALHKSKSVVLVKRYQGGKRQLRFISQNAAILGCNVEALLQGNRLSEDYIHPEDRDEVLDGVYKAIANSLSDCVQTYRMVGDDGACRYVRSEITITHLSDLEADVEFLITDITEEKEYEQQLLRQQRDYEQEIDFIMKGYEKTGEGFDVASVLENGFMEELIEAFVTVTGLYSVVVDLEGQFITKPVGNMAHLGEFYDLFERPFYKELYLKMNRQLIEGREALALEMNDGNPYSRIAGAPIMLDDRHVATWIICGFSKEERDKLLSVYRAHYSLAQQVSVYLFNEAVVDKEIKRSRLNEHRLEKQLEKQSIITELLSNLHGNNKHSLESILERAGKYLDVGRINYFSFNDHTKSFGLLKEWDGKRMDKDVNKQFTWQANSIFDVRELMKKQDYLTISDQQCSQKIKQLMLQRGVKSMLIVPISQEDKIVGYLTCGEHRRHRVWQDNEIQFMKNIRDIVQMISVSSDDADDLHAMTASLVAAYDYCSEIMYVRDAYSGEIFYANKAAEKAFGIPLVGYDSNQIAKSMMAEYEHNPTMRKHFVYNKNVTKWESYIKQLDKIMLVEEVRVEWYEHKEAKLVILINKA